MFETVARLILVVLAVTSVGLALQFAITAWNSPDAREIRTVFSFIHFVLAACAVAVLIFLPSF